MLDRASRFVKYFPRNVARLGTGRDTGENVMVWAGVAPASFGRRPFYRNLRGPATTPSPLPPLHVGRANTNSFE